MGREQRYKDIQLPQLRGFCLAAAHGNFTTAAKALGVSAPTVWQQVRALERRLQTTLLRRKGRAVELTPEGRMLFDLVQPHVSGLDSLEPLFVARQAGMPRQLTVTSIPYLISGPLLRPVREFNAAGHDVRLRLQVCVWFEEAADLVEQGQADLGIVFYDRDAPRRPHLDYERLFDLQFTLLTPPDHPLNRKRKLQPSDLVAHPLIVSPEGSFARRTFEQLVQRHNLADQAHIVMEATLLDIIRKYVGAGIGIGLVHLNPEVDPMPEVKARAFDAPDAISVALVIRKGAHLSEPARTFREMLRSCLSRPAAKD